MKRVAYRFQRTIAAPTSVSGIGFLTGPVSNVSVWLLETFPSLQRLG